MYFGVYCQQHSIDVNKTAGYYNLNELYSFSTDCHHLNAPYKTQQTNTSNWNQNITAKVNRNKTFEKLKHNYISSFL